MKVFKNIIPKPYQDRIENIMSDVSFKWGLLSDVTYGSDSAMRNKFPNAQGSVGFAHLFADRASQTQSDNLDFILPLLLHFTETNDFDLIRIKGGLLLPTTPYRLGSHNMPHVDYEEQGITTALYYVNDSDGDTVFFDDTYNIVQRIKPEKGKVVIFDNLIYHASTCPQVHNTRMVINFNYALD